MQATSEKLVRVVIAGGGFGGIAAARWLDRYLGNNQNVQVTLVNRENYFLFTPMLHEVASGELEPSNIGVPLRRLVRRVTTVTAEVVSIDLKKRSVTLARGVQRERSELPYDQLLLAFGSETNFAAASQVQNDAVTMKSLGDAVLLRNRIIASLELATLEPDRAIRASMLTFVVAGGGFAGVETLGAVADLLTACTKNYPVLKDHAARLVLVHGGEIILPELGDDLGRFTEKKLRQRHVELKLKTHVTAYHDNQVVCSDGVSIAAHTLIWTAGVIPSGAIDGLTLPMQKGRVTVDEHLAVVGYPNVWAIGDCAAVVDSQTQKLYHTTAQHAQRQGALVARNIAASIAKRTLEAFTYKSLGSLASIGARTGVARVFGLHVSGYLGWVLWRSVYLFKLPQLDKKIRVGLAWFLDLFFSRDLVQHVTLRDIASLRKITDNAKSALPATNSTRSNPPNQKPNAAA